MLILAGVTLGSVFWDGGVFNRAETVGNKYNEAKAREVLETVLLADGQYEKNINPDYNQDAFLDKLIKNEIPGSDVKGDVAIVGGWAFELDRSVPKIGRGLGRADKLVFPTVTVSEPELAPNYRTASFTAKSIEKENGINRIELWLEGKRIETHTESYSNVKTEIIKDFTVHRNGTYTVKVYGDLMASETVEVTGIVPSVEFMPNGSTEWKKQHTTKVEVKETGETITGMKYIWVKDDGVNEPAISAFIEDCPSDGIITTGNETMTGTYYLWILLTVGSGENQKTNICASQGFNFDNEGPKILGFTYDVISPTSFSLTCNSEDYDSGIVMYEFYENNNLIKKIATDKNKCTTNIYEISNTDLNYEIKVYDACDNCASSRLTNKDNISIWARYKLLERKTFGVTNSVSSKGYVTPSSVRSVLNWSYSNELVATDNGCMFVTPGVGDNLEKMLFEDGTAKLPLYYNLTYGGASWVVYRLNFAKYENGNYRINYTSYIVGEGIIYEKGNFERYENYTNSGTHPTEGKYEDGYYEQIKLADNN